MTNKQRSIKQISYGYQTMEGGFQIRRAFPSQQAPRLDPFLMLDHMGPMQVKPGEKAGVSPHPHRGFETVTYIFEGEIEHKDSQQNHGFISPGEVQWMTAASGIVHSEFPSDRFSEKGGSMHGLQLWVNLPAKHKMDKPKYQEIKFDQIPEIKVGQNSSLRLIAGDYQTHTGAAKTYTPMAYFHLKLAKNDAVDFSFNSQWTANVYVVDGSIKTGDKTINEAELVQYNNDGEDFSLQSNSENVSNIMILAGQPIGEPVVSYGPFVMNTEEEIYTAFSDFQAGTFGEIKAEVN